MKALFESLFSFFLMLQHSKAFRDHRPIRRRADAAEEGGGSAFLEGSIARHDRVNDIVEQQRPQFQSDVQPNQVRVHAGESHDGITEDPIDSWLNNVFDRYHVSGKKRTSKSKSKAHALPKNNRKSSSSRKKNTSSSGDGSNFSQRGEGLIGARVDPADNWLNNVFDPKVKDDPIDDWLSNIYDHYNLPGMPSAPRSSKTIGSHSKKTSSGKKENSSSGTAALPIDKWLNTIYDHYDIPGVSLPSKTSSDKKNMESKGRGRSKKSNGNRSSKGSRTRKPQTLQSSSPTSELSSLPSAATTSGPSFSPTITASPSNRLCNEHSSKQESSKGKGKGGGRSKYISASSKSSLCEQSASPSPGGSPTVSPRPTVVSSKNSKNAKASKSPTLSQRSRSKSKRSKRSPATEPPSAAPSKTTTPTETSDLPSPTLAPSLSITVPTRVPATRAPTTGIGIITQICSTYELASGNPAQVEFDAAADLTCEHFNQFVSETFAMGEPSILLEDATCEPTAFLFDPVQICYEIVTVFDRESLAVLDEEDVQDFVCLALLPPEVDALLADLMALPPSSPFSDTTGLTCDDSTITPAPIIAPVDTLAPITSTLAPESVPSTAAPASVPSAPVPNPTVPISSPIEVPSDPVTRSPVSISVAPVAPPTAPVSQPIGPPVAPPTASTAPVAPPVPRPVSPPVPSPMSPPVPRPVSPPVSPPQPVPATPSPVMAPSTTTDAPMQGPTNQSRVPTAGTAVLSQVCSTFESATGNPSDEDFNEAVGLTCAHLEQYIATTFELGAPFILLDDVSCRDITTSTDPNRICYEIAVTFAEDSVVIPTQEDVDSLICIALLPPEVEVLLMNLSSLMPSNPFARTTELTCDITAVTDAPTGFPTAAPSETKTFSPVISTEAPIGVTPPSVAAPSTEAPVSPPIPFTGAPVISADAPTNAPIDGTPAPVTTSVPSTEAPSVISTSAPIDGTPAPVTAPVPSTEAPSVISTNAPIDPTPVPVATPIFSTEAPLVTSTNAPIDVTPAPVATPILSTEAPIRFPTTQTRAPTSGTVVLSQMCSIYETLEGNPSQEDFNVASDHTCSHVEEFITRTFEMGAPFSLFESADCLPIDTSANPIQICYEIAVSFSPDSSLVPTQDEVDSLICIALLPPEVDTLLDDLALLGANNPFSRTSALTCDRI